MPNVLNAVSQLGLKPLKRRLKSMELTETRASSTGNQLPRYLTWHFQPANIRSGIIEKTEVTPDARNTGYSLLGWIDLQSARQVPYDSRRSLMRTMAISLEGDWQNMPLGGVLSMERQFTYQFAVTGMRAALKVGQYCKVSAIQTARDLHPQLVGDAKRLICGPSQQTQPSEVAYYLEDYGVVVPLESYSTADGNFNFERKLSILRVDAEN